MLILATSPTASMLAPMRTRNSNSWPRQHIANWIFRLRGRKVLLDFDLAALHGMTTAALLRAVNRHAARFPKDFMLQLTKKEWLALRSQVVISEPEREAPYAFTEQGVAMLSSVLKTESAISTNIEIIRAFMTERAATSPSPNESW